MKMLILSLLLPALTFASSGTQVGEYIKHQFSVAGQAGVILSKVEKYEGGDHLYTVSTTTDMQGRRTVEYASTHEDEMWTRDSGKDVLAFCSILGGMFEDVSYKGQTFKTCRLPVQGEGVKSIMKFFGFPLPKDAQGEVWIGDFAVNGIFKMKTDVYNLNITDMKWNQ